MVTAPQSWHTNTVDAHASFSVAWHKQHSQHATTRRRLYTVKRAFQSAWVLSLLTNKHNTNTQNKSLNALHTAPGQPCNCNICQLQSQLPTRPQQQFGRPGRHLSAQTTLASSWCEALQQHLHRTHTNACLCQCITTEGLHRSKKACWQS